MVLAALILCSGVATPQPSASGEPAGGSMILATTTSTYDTGLLDALIPPFSTRTGVNVKVIAVGSGQALAMAARGEADLVLTHAPEAEARFMERGHGLLRRRMMYNDFVLVGPPTDPAGVRRSSDVRKALASIQRSGSTFASRADESGTHMMEQKLWYSTGLEPPSGSSYLETGQGMAATLRVASQKRAYTLTDRGTFLAQKHVLDLEILVEGDPALQNIYHLIVVNPENGPRVNVDGAKSLARYLLGEKVLRQVGEFGRDRYGQPLFIPDAELYSEP
ncbi:MAG: substrate-binding domain-containing protein [Acidobacteria bacterium]|nr:substrate-binding domain-containing protein [Acidobacteriota bacterium]